MKTNHYCGVLELGPNEKAKTLGLMWACQTDSLTYNIKNDLVIQSQRATKRVVLSISMNNCRQNYNVMSVVSQNIVERSFAESALQCLDKISGGIAPTK